ncbi:MAG: pyruvate ferredoxin oxidoreductase [Rhodobacteraceae bacterium]|nr:pyruvate ferredoxin oxidoreductase [Paracoccaceae bacterium]
MNAPLKNRNLKLLNGNHAVAWGVRLAAPDVAPLYPITPQTPILEKLIEFQSQDLFDAELLTPESEHSAMASAISASALGARVFTATSSQGLLLMHELLHYAAGARVPIVMFNVNRTPAAPWGFWPDQIDSLAQRDTGWVQLYCENPQDSLDTVIQAFRIAETTELPVMVNHDAFWVSHSVEPVDLPAADLVQSFLPRVKRSVQMELGTGRALSAPADQASWNLSRRDMDVAMHKVPGLIDAAGREWGDLTGRVSAPVETDRCDDAEIVFVTMGSMAGTAREAVNRLRDTGIRAGLVKVRLFRPLPVAELRDVLAGVPGALVLDRNYSPGTGGVLHQELKSALFGINEAPNLFGLLTGVGGINVPVETLVSLAQEYRGADPVSDPVWVE